MNMFQIITYLNFYPLQAVILLVFIVFGAFASEEQNEAKTERRLGKVCKLNFDLLRFSLIHND